MATQNKHLDADATDSHLKKWRMHAAEASGGISNEHIYQRFEEVLRTQRLVSASVLDFGAGQGALCRRLLESGIFSSIAGIDILGRPEDIDSAVVWNQGDLNQLTDFDDEAFDVLVSSEVIEHLENPRAVVREWFRILKPGGVLLFSTPNNESLRSILALVFRSHFAAFGEASYPAHITALLTKDIERILCEAGFELSNFFFTDQGGIPRFENVTWQSVSLGFFKGLRFSDNLLALARRPARVAADGQ